MPEDLNNNKPGAVDGGKASKEKEENKSTKAKVPGSKEISKKEVAAAPKVDASKKEIKASSGPAAIATSTTPPKATPATNLTTPPPPKASADTYARDTYARDTPKSSNSKTEGKTKSELTSKMEEPKKLQLKELIRKHLLAGSIRMDYELWELHQLLDIAKISMQKKDSLIEVRAPINICGDIHGQYSDLMRIFNSCGMPFKSRYLFLGDYVDRGRHSLEVIVLLLACQIQFPNNVFLLRGNHELPNINRVYGFYAEIRTRYRSILDSKHLYEHFNEIFSEMPLAAIVEGKILCMHGGLSPDLNHLDDIRKIKRPIMIVPRGLAQDLLWSDPESGVKGFQPNKIRAVSHVFGEDAVQAKIKQLGIDMVIRAHQVVEFGYAFFANRQLVTVFSAARYHEDMCNYAAVVQIDARLELNFMQLKPCEYDRKKKEKIDATADCDEENDENDNNPAPNTQ